MTAYKRDGGEWVESVPHARTSGAWTEDDASFYARSGGEHVLIYPDPTATGSLLPVESLQAIIVDDHTVTIDWTNPTQPTITPTHVAVRLAATGAVWDERTYPITEFTWIALESQTTYVAQVRLVEYVDGVQTTVSTIKHVEFTTDEAPIGVPAPDPGGSGGDSLIPVTGGANGGGGGDPPGTTDGCWWEWKIQVLTPSTLTWTDEGTTGTVSGAGGNISYDLSLLDSTMVYRICRRSACDTTSSGTADTFGSWGDCSQSFIGGTDWDLTCGGHPGNSTDADTPVVEVYADDFDRADTTKPASIGDWANDTNWEIASNRVELGGTAASDVVRYDSAMADDDHWVQADVSQSNDPSYRTGIAARVDGASSFYAFVRCDSATNTIYQLWRNNSDDFAGAVQIGSDVGWNTNWVSAGEVPNDGSGDTVIAGDARMRFEVIGSSLKGFCWNFTDDVWDLVISETDATYATGLNVGFTANRLTGGAYLNNWKAGTGVTVTGANVFNDAAYAFPTICTDDDADRVVLTERVSGVEVGRGADYLWAFNDGSDWMVQADSDGGTTMLAPIAALETLMLPTQDATYVVRHAFDDGHTLSARTYPIAVIGGLGLSFWITETVTGWTPEVHMQLATGPVVLEGTEVALGTSVHTFTLRFDADGDKDFWVDGVEVDTDASGTDWAAFSILPMYVTAAKEYGITGQQAGWNRLLSDAEIEELEGGLTFTYTTSGTFRVPDGVTSILVDDVPTVVTAQSDYTVTHSGTDVVIGLVSGAPTWTYEYFLDAPFVWKAPDQARTPTFTARGAQGRAGAGGAEVICTYTPTTGSDWAVWVGKYGQSGSGGGWPGGGRGCTANNQGNSGGGLSSVQPNTDLVDHTVDLANTIVCAGGGGGNNSWQGNSAGGGGYPNGQDATAVGTKGGYGGTQSAGGLGGTSANAGSFGTGGPGASHGPVAWQEGAGGGAGYYGGGASGHDGNAAGGGGGSSKIHASATLVSSTDASQSSNGQVVISI